MFQSLEEQAVEVVVDLEHVLSVEKRDT